MAPVEGGPRRFARVLTPLALFLLAFWVRCLPLQSIFLREGIVLFDPDAYYHMRRIVFTALNFPKTLISRRHFGAAPATMAGVILALLSGHCWYSQVGFIDHHAAEALAATAMLGAGMTLLANASAVSAAADGRYALRVPHSTQGGPPWVEVDPAYRLECDDQQQFVREDESDVMEGARVEGPRLCVGS